MIGKYYTRAIFLVLVVAMSTVTSLECANAADNRVPVLEGKIAPWEAITIAQSKISGLPIQANFEFDEGKWFYGVMIMSENTIKEVDIDAVTGEVGDIEILTPQDEADEVKAELTKALGSK